MTMEETLRYIMIAVVLYVVGIEAYNVVLARKVDYWGWAIIGLFGIVIWL